MPTTASRIDPAKNHPPNTGAKLQKAVIQTAIEFFQPGQHFTIREIIELMETGIAEGNPLDIVLSVNVQSQVAGILRNWHRNQLWIKEVKRMVGRRRLEIPNEGQRPQQYYWTGNPVAKALAVVPRDIEAEALVEPEVITVPIHYGTKAPEILFSDGDHVLIRWDGRLWAAKPFSWERG